MVIIELKNKIATTDVLGQVINYYHLIINSDVKSEIEILYNYSIELNPYILLFANSFDGDLINSIEYIKNIRIYPYIFNDKQIKLITYDNYKNIDYNLNIQEKEYDLLFEKIKRDFKQYSEEFNKQLRIIERNRQVIFYINKKNIFQVKKKIDYFITIKCDVDVNLIKYCPVCSDYRFNKDNIVLEVHDSPTELIKEIINGVC